MPKIAVDGLHEALGLVRERECRVEPQQRHDGTHDATRSGQIVGRIRNERDRSAPTRRHSSRRRRQAGRATPARCSGPPRNSTMSTRRPNNARRFTSIMRGPIVHVTRRTAPLMIDTADALTAFAASAATRTRARSRHRIHARENLSRGVVPAADRRRRQRRVHRSARDGRSVGARAAARRARRREDHARRAPGSRSAAAGGRHGAAGVRHADRRGARRPSLAGGLCASWCADCSAWSSPRRTRAPTGRAGRCPPSSRNTRSTTCGTSPRCAQAC